MPKLVTLEGIGSVATKETFVQPTSPRLTSKDAVMNIADAIQDLGIMLDCVGAENTPKERMGKSWGINANSPTGVGVFTDKSNNTIVIYSRRTVAGEAMHQSMLNTQARRGATFIVPDTRDNRHQQALLVQQNLTLSAAAWEQGLSNKLIVVEAGRYEPFDWVGLFSKLITYASTIGNIALPGLSQYIGVAANTLIKVADGEITPSEIGNVAALFAPDDVRKYIDKGVSIYTKLNKANYLEAAKECGIVSPALMQQFRDTTDWTQIAKITTGGFEDTLSKLQNILNFDSVNVLRGMGLTSELENEIKKYGSITKIKEYQDAILAGIAPNTLLTMIPNFSGSVNAIINYTNDIQTPQEFKTFLGASVGIPFGENSLDNISVKSLSDRVIKVLSTKVKDASDTYNEFALSPTVPKEKREYFATEISKNTGANILTTTGTSNTTSNIRKATPYIIVGGVATALYFYSRKN